MSELPEEVHRKLICRTIEYAINYLKTNLDDQAVEDITGRYNEANAKKLEAILESLVDRGVMTLQVATVTHREGASAYVAFDQSQLMDELADYCREWWPADMPKGSYMPKGSKHLVEKYFDQNVADENWDLSIAYLKFETEKKE